jgi:hypothetical protein
MPHTGFKAGDNIYELVCRWLKQNNPLEYLGEERTLLFPEPVGPMMLHRYINSLVVAPRNNARNNYIV